MQLFHPSRAVIASLIVALGACAAESSGPASADFAASAARPAAACINVAAEAFGPLGIWSEGGFGGFGLAPTPVVLGNEPGTLASFVANESISGSKGQGAHHIILSHVFWSADGESWFRTEDRASCAPADNNPATCAVNDHLSLVEGAGIYENAAGQLHNHGLITFTSVAPPAGTLDLRIRGRVCGDGAAIQT